MGRGVRAFVAVFLTVFVACGLLQVEAWPFSGWTLFSHLRTDEVRGWLATGVDADGVERPVPFSIVPRRLPGPAARAQGLRRPVARRAARTSAGRGPTELARRPATRGRRDPHLRHDRLRPAPRVAGRRPPPRVPRPVNAGRAVTSPVRAGDRPPPARHPGRAGRGDRPADRPRPLPRPGRAAARALPPGVVPPGARRHARAGGDRRAAGRGHRRRRPGRGRLAPAGHLSRGLGVPAGPGRPAQQPGQVPPQRRPPAPGGGALPARPGRALAATDAGRASARFGWPVHTALVVVAGAYFFSGLAKLVHSGRGVGHHRQHALRPLPGGRRRQGRLPRRPHLAGGSGVAGPRAGGGRPPARAHLPRRAPRAGPAETGSEPPTPRGAVAFHAGTWLALGLDYWAWAAVAAVVLVDWCPSSSGSRERLSRYRLGRPPRSGRRPGTRRPAGRRRTCGTSAAEKAEDRTCENAGPATQPALVVARGRRRSPSSPSSAS